MKMKLRVEGAAEVVSRIKDLNRKMQNKIMRPAVTAACRPIRQAAKANVPMGSGNLKASIETKVKTGRTAVYGVIGPRSDVAGTRTDLWGRVVREKPSLIAHLVEGGAKAHVIGIGKNRRVIWHHPGYSGVRFMERAQQSTAGRVQSILAEKIAAGIEKYA